MSSSEQNVNYVPTEEELTKLAIVETASGAEMSPQSRDFFLLGLRKARAAEAANDNNPALPRAVVPAEWEGEPLPERQWLIPDLIPSRTVTLLSGDGGVGKSLLATQIGVAMSLGLATLDLEPTPGTCLYLGAEDDADEFHRRISDIARAHGRSLGDVRDFHLLPMAGMDALLSAPDRGGKMEPTRVWRDLTRLARDLMPSLIVLDTSADLFGGDEIKRSQVRQFIGALRGLAIELDCAVVLLSHPSLTGITTGTGTSGSTAWSNSVRSRLYMEKEIVDKAETGAILLRTKKSNYGPVGAEIKLRWEDGAFVLDDGRPSPAQGLMAGRAKGVFVTLLSKLNRQGQSVGAARGTNYAPAVMSKHDEAAGITKKDLERAMRVLMDEGTVKLVQEGPPSKRRQRLILLSEDFGGE